MEILETWDGPVYWNESDTYYSDLESAVELIADDLWDKGVYDISRIPEFVYACPPKFPQVQVAEWVVEHIDENHMVDDNPFGEHVTAQQEKELDDLINTWIENVGWTYWEPDMNKAIRIRADIEQHIKEL